MKNWKKLATAALATAAAPAMLFVPTNTAWNVTIACEQGGLNNVEVFY
jgi:hypothetical protein